MDTHTFIDKRKIGRTEIGDFTDYQGIGSDPLYKRYESVYSIIKRIIEPQYAHFLARPKYAEDDESIYWYVEEWRDTPECYTQLSDEKKVVYQPIKEETIAHYQEAAKRLSGEEKQVFDSALRYIHDDFIYCFDNKVYVLAWGMTPDTRRHISTGELVHESPYVVKKQITFNAGEHGSITPPTRASISLAIDSKITANDIPSVVADEGYEFTGWFPNPLDEIVKSDLTFSANYTKKAGLPPDVIAEPTPETLANISFDVGEHGTSEGETSIRKVIGSRIWNNDIPVVSPHKGYKFIGWSPDPLDMFVKGDTEFSALYEKKTPWHKRLWLWLSGKGCLKWLLWFLLSILLFFLIAWLLNNCVGCNRSHNGVIKSEKIATTSGEKIDNNGATRPINLNNGRLPDNTSIVSPIRDENGNLPPIQENDGLPPIVSNRLFIFLEDESDNVDNFATDFKRIYPGDKYSIIGFDREIKSLVIQIPESERDHIRQTINARIPNHQFLVLDESIYKLHGRSSSTTTTKPGWHLTAVNARKGWEITKGRADVVVAIVDDGIDATHPLFDGRITNAYNIYTQNNRLSHGEGHGTHIAGVAVGSLDYLDQGAAGIAPNCMLMPIQVFDNDMCTLSALISGIMYAIHKNADVVNISTGPDFQMLSLLPENQQEEIARTMFKNEELLWKRLCKIAQKKHTILVFAAGNDDIFSSIAPENRPNTSISVGAITPDLNPTIFTNYGPGTDVSAPGIEIYSSLPNKKFGSCDGTSMAAPIVCGTIALMKSINKDLTVEQIKNVLYKTGKRVHGYMPPLIQVDLALNAVKRGDFSRPEQIANGDDHTNGIGYAGTDGQLDHTGNPGVGNTPGGQNGIGNTAPNGNAGLSSGGRNNTGNTGTGNTPGGQNGIGNTAPNGNAGLSSGGRNNTGNTGTGNTPGNAGRPGDGRSNAGNAGGATNTNVGGANSQPNNQNDYDAIRRLISIYKQKIAELEKQLPENK